MGTRNIFVFLLHYLSSLFNILLNPNRKYKYLSQAKYVLTSEIIWSVPTRCENRTRSVKFPAESFITRLIDQLEYLIKGSSIRIISYDSTKISYQYS